MSTVSVSMLPAELVWLELWADWMWSLESEPACGCAGVGSWTTGRPPFLYQQGQEYPLWTIFPDLEILNVSKLPIENSMINKINYNYAEVNNISSNIWCFTFARVFFFPSSMHGEVTSVLLTDVIMQSLLGAGSVSSIKWTLIPWNGTSAFTKSEV